MSSLQTKLSVAKPLKNKQFKLPIQESIQLIDEIRRHQKHQRIIRPDQNRIEYLNLLNWLNTRLQSTKELINKDITQFPFPANQEGYQKQTFDQVVQAKQRDLILICMKELSGIFKKQCKEKAQLMDTCIYYFSQLIKLYGKHYERQIKTIIEQYNIKLTDLESNYEEKLNKCNTTIQELQSYKETKWKNIYMLVKDNRVLRRQKGKLIRNIQQQNQRLRTVQKELIQIVKENQQNKLVINSENDDQNIKKFVRNRLSLIKFQKMIDEYPKKAMKIMKDDLVRLEIQELNGLDSKIDHYRRVIFESGADQNNFQQYEDSHEVTTNITKNMVFNIYTQTDTLDVQPLKTFISEGMNTDKPEKAQLDIQTEVFEYKLQPKAKEIERFIYKRNPRKKTTLKNNKNTSSIFKQTGQIRLCSAQISMNLSLKLKKAGFQFQINKNTGVSYNPFQKNKAKLVFIYACYDTTDRSEKDDSDQSQQFQATIILPKTRHHANRNKTGSLKLQKLNKVSTANRSFNLQRIKQYASEIQNQVINENQSSEQSSRRSSLDPANGENGQKLNPSADQEQALTPSENLGRHKGQRNSTKSNRQSDRGKKCITEQSCAKQQQKNLQNGNDQHHQFRFKEICNVNTQKPQDELQTRQNWIKSSNFRKSHTSSSRFRSSMLQNRNSPRLSTEVGRSSFGNRLSSCNEGQNNQDNDKILQNINDDNANDNQNSTQQTISQSSLLSIPSIVGKSPVGKGKGKGSGKYRFSSIDSGFKRNSVCNNSNDDMLQQINETIAVTDSIKGIRHLNNSGQRISVRLDKNRRTSQFDKIKSRLNTCIQYDSSRKTTAARQSIVYDNLSVTSSWRAPSSSRNSTSFDGRNNVYQHLLTAEDLRNFGLEAENMNSPIQMRAFEVKRTCEKVIKAMYARRKQLLSSSNPLSLKDFVVFMLKQTYGKNWNSENKNILRYLFNSEQHDTNSNIRVFETMLNTHVQRQYLNDLFRLFVTMLDRNEYCGYENPLITHKSKAIAVMKYLMSIYFDEQTGLEIMDSLPFINNDQTNVDLNEVFIVVQSQLRKFTVQTQIYQFLSKLIPQNQSIISFDSFKEVLYFFKHDQKQYHIHLARLKYFFANNQASQAVQKSSNQNGNSKIYRNSKTMQKTQTKWDKLSSTIRPSNATIADQPSSTPSSQMSYHMPIHLICLYLKRYHWNDFVDINRHVEEKYTQMIGVYIQEETLDFINKYCIRFLDQSLYQKQAISEAFPLINQGYVPINSSSLCPHKNMILSAANHPLFRLLQRAQLMIKDYYRYKIELSRPFCMFVRLSIVNYEMEKATQVIICQQLQMLSLEYKKIKSLQQIQKFIKCKQ